MTGPSPQVSTTAGSQPKLNTRNLSTNVITTNNVSSQELSFSLMSRPDTVLAEFMATAYIQYSEWTGEWFNMLFDKNIDSRDNMSYTLFTNIMNFNVIWNI